MDTRKLSIMGIAVALMVLVMLALTLGPTQAQGPVPGQVEGPQPPVESVRVQGEAGVEATVQDDVPIQGRLTDPSGNPVPDGNYTMEFWVYESEGASTPLCVDTKSVTVTNGLFNSTIDLSPCQGDFYGQELYLGIRVESDAEMAPRLPIYPVPYAMSLRPGAKIEGPGPQTLVVRNTGTGDGDAIRAYGGDEGEALTANSPNGTAVYAQSDTGVAIRAEGTGVIQSSAPSYHWISGNGVRPYHQSDATVIDMDSIGGAMIRRGPGGGSRIVMLPITVVGPLYGQDVTVTALDIYWKGETEFDAITGVILRRQMGVCDTCSANIVFDVGTSYVCDHPNNPEGCTLPYDLTENNVLTADSGVLYLALEFAFNSDTSYIELGGIRLTLQHD